MASESLHRLARTGKDRLGWSRCEIITPDAVQINSRPFNSLGDWVDRVVVRDGYWNNIRKLEGHLVKTALEEAKGNKAEAARILGVQRRLLYEKMTELGIKV